MVLGNLYGQHNEGKLIQACYICWQHAVLPAILLNEFIPSCIPTQCKSVVYYPRVEPRGRVARQALIMFAFIF